MSPKYRFYVEHSLIPIYQRIIKALTNAFAQLGHRVESAAPVDFSGLDDYIRHINSQKFDFVLITNSSSSLYRRWEVMGGYGFEFVNTNIVFIHHDSLFSSSRSLEEIRCQLIAFHLHRERSYHFCLESSNLADLKSLGLPYVYSLEHASEYPYLSIPQTYQYEVSFVGHLKPFLGDKLSDLPFSHRLRADVWQRIVNLDTSLEKSANAFVAMTCSTTEDLFELLSLKHYYMLLLHGHSMRFRGEIVRRIRDALLDVFGGDPGYINGYESEARIESERIRYHPPLTDYQQTCEIYRNSKINLNITSLQFDTSVINRVIDVAAVGGFVLTDYRSDLEKITSVANHISYRSIEELNDKLRYYLHPDHQSERLEIAYVLHQEVAKKHTYSAVADSILLKISHSSTSCVSHLKVDLGCGNTKMNDFTGVDISAGPNVDIIADLNRRFPFPDSSVEAMRAYNILEYLNSQIHAMNEIWRICRHGAEVEIRVASTDGRGAFQDPTLTSFWNVNSFNYYCVEFPTYWHLCMSYGFRGAFNLVCLQEEISKDDVVHIRAVLRASKQLD